MWYRCAYLQLWCSIIQCGPHCLNSSSSVQGRTGIIFNTQQETEQNTAVTLPLLLSILFISQVWHQLTGASLKAPVTRRGIQFFQSSTQKCKYFPSPCAWFYLMPNFPLRLIKSEEQFHGWLWQGGSCGKMPGDTLCWVQLLPQWSCCRTQ